jgi:uncharacterized protein
MPSVGTRLARRLAGLPRPRTGSVTRTTEVVPASDGVSLMTDVYRQRDDATQATLLARSPYGRAGAFGFLIGRLVAEQGFNIVVQSCRGTKDSGGEFRPVFDERADGLATIRWIEQQPWFDGRLGLYGLSYLGYAQWAVADDPAVRAMCPAFTMSDIAAHWFAGDTFSLGGALDWGVLVTTQDWPLRKRRQAQRKLARSAPLTSLPVGDLDRDAAGVTISFWRDIVDHATFADPHWDPARHSDRVADVIAGVSMVTGWYDLFLSNQLADHATLVHNGRTVRLTIGPWPHASLDSQRALLRDTVDFMHERLDGAAPDPSRAPVRLCVMGTKEWKDFASWPPPGYEPQPWFLGDARNSGGALTPSPPVASGQTLLPFDPIDPPPYVGGAMIQRGGRRRQDTTEARADVLTFTSAPMEHPLEIIGELRATVHVSCDRPTFDVFVRLCEVDDKGRSWNIADGIQRTVVDRDDADAVHAVTVHLAPTAYCYRRGTRIRVQVAAGAHPHFARNFGTLAPLADATDADLVAANIVVHHGDEHPSSISLPVPAPR